MTQILTALSHPHLRPGMDWPPVPSEPAVRFNYPSTLTLEDMLDGPGQRAYTVILVSGREDGGKRATLAASMACTALSMELDTQMFLVGEGSYWAYDDHVRQARMEGFPALHELMDDFQDLGGQITVCSTCDKSLCGIASRDQAPVRRRPGVQVQGMAALMSRVMAGPVVTF